MSAPVRTPFFVATDTTDEDVSTWTLRQAMEYYKKGIRVVTKYQPISPLEQRVVDEAWVSVVTAIAEREKIPVGPLSYFLGETALTELNLAKVAQNELEQARGYDPQ